MSSIPRRDVASVALPQRIFAPLVAARGNIDRLLRRRLTDDRFDPASVWIAVNEGNRTVTEHIDRGAVGWIAIEPDDASTPTEPEESDTEVLSLHELLQQRNESNAVDQWPYLIHCTRERIGAWPDQSEQAYCEEILLLARRIDDDAIDVLRRIVQSERLIASANITRGSHRVICFSERPVEALTSKRVFRSHLGRWDYEPFGIAIRKTLAKTLGLRPVIYGDDADFQALPQDQQPFFQNKGTRNDWTQEREWRGLGDLDLSLIAADDAFIFVDSVAAAQRLAPQSRWPIVVLCV
ncbi:MAG: hypothetical protein R3C05_22465 [Pirellulaceae bacterium]